MQTSKHLAMSGLASAALAASAGSAHITNTVSEEPEPEVNPDSRQVRRAKERREFKPAPKLNPWRSPFGVIDD